MSIRHRSSALAALASAIGAAAMFVLTTVSMDSMPDAVLVGLSVVAAFVIALVAQGSSSLAELRALDRVTLATAAVGGVLCFWAAPLLALGARASDAPSGADTLLLTTSAWGLLCVLAGWISRSERPHPAAVAAAFTAVAGAIGVLASWESPSSFSPFAKFPGRESLMLLAGVLFAAGTLALVASLGRGGARATTLAGLGAAAIVGLVVALSSMPAADELARGVLLPCLYLGGAVALFALAWIRSLSLAGVSRASVSLLAVPVVVMSLAAVERATTVYGPNPIAWSGALAGSAVIASGIAALWLAEKPAPDAAPAPSARGPLRFALWASLGSCALALAALATPALQAVAEGGVSTPFRAQWTQLGFESVAGWLAVAAAGSALAAVVAARRASTARSWVPSAVSAVLCAVASVPLLGVTIHTWNRWVPAEVQQTYGTEYSRLTTQAQLDPVRIAALVLAIIVVGMLVFSARRGALLGGAQKEDAR